MECYVMPRRFILTTKRAPREGEAPGEHGGVTLCRQGVCFATGVVIVETTLGTLTYSNVGLMLHDNAEWKMAWRDPICFRCGAVLDPDEIAARHCYACGAGQGEKLHMDTEPSPSLGQWTPALTIPARPAPEEPF